MARAEGGETGEYRVRKPREETASRGSGLPGQTTENSEKMNI